MLHIFKQCFHNPLYFYNYIYFIHYFHHMIYYYKDSSMDEILEFFDKAEAAGQTVMSVIGSHVSYTFINPVIIQYIWLKFHVKIILLWYFLHHLLHKFYLKKLHFKYLLIGIISLFKMKVTTSYLILLCILIRANY